MASIQFGKPYYNVASEANTVATEEAHNVYFEALPQGGFAIRRRPGMTFVEDSIPALGYSDGIYWSDRNKRLFFTKEGEMRQKTSAAAPSTGLGPWNQYDNNPTIFAEGQKLNLDSLIYIANGQPLQYIDPTLNTLIVPPSTSVPSSTFVMMMNNIFFANSTLNNQDFYITDVNPATLEMDVTYWDSATNPRRVTQKPDALSGIFTGWNEIFLWGTLACEVWQEDGVNPISPLVGSIIECGLAAPYSVVMADNSMFALGSLAGKRAVVHLQGRTPKVISEPIANVLQSYTTVSDAVGALCFVGGLNMYLLSFPTENVTWAYDIKTDVWCQWGTWNSALAADDVFAGRFHAYAKDWNKHYTLSPDGILYEMDRSVFSDNGNPIHSSIRTGWIDHGTWDRKRSNQLIIKLKGYLNSDAKVSMRWRSDGFNEWSQPLIIDIEATQQNDHFCKLNRMGTYRSRQYEFTMTDAQDLALVGMEEDVDRLRN
jgi:hypothetical protein